MLFCDSPPPNIDDDLRDVDSDVDNHLLPLNFRRPVAPIGDHVCCVAGVVLLAPDAKCSYCYLDIW